MQPQSIEVVRSRLPVPAAPGIALRVPALPAERRGAPMVAPFARALALLGAFTAHDRWLTNREIAQRTGLPPTTVTRIAQSLVLLGHLGYDAALRRYRLAAPVLALGYGAVASCQAHETRDVQRTTRTQMQAFADRYELNVHLGVRDRLDMIVVEACRSVQPTRLQALPVGAREGLAASSAGWALLAALPEAERFYLLEHLERRAPRDWARLRRRCVEGIAQVQRQGFGVAMGEGEGGRTMVCVPLSIEAQAPQVLVCTGAALTRARVEREIGLRLMATADAIRQAARPEKQS